jgi:O-antigen/teichoic acid export membrane protein
MKIDCSKLSNKDDLLALVGILIIVIAVATAFAIAAYINTFTAGFFSATIVWKWKEWLYRPIDRLLDKLWSSDQNI